ncbi:transcriptional Coactivator p15-domain-containing protein [Schizophyllum fasciatum]
MKKPQIPRKPRQYSDDESDSDPKPTAKKRKSKNNDSKPATKKGKSVAKSDSEEESDDEDVKEAKPRSPKVQKQKKQSDVSSTEVALKDDGGTKYIDLGKMKRASISEFKGQRFVDIREYYIDKASGEGRPGKKGIALNAEQWNALKQSINTIDELFASK